MELVATWTEKTKLNMNIRNQKQNMGSAKTTSKSWFWISVVIIDMLILIDLFLNSGKVLIGLLFSLTGGYGF